jgi:hypothetical protein
LNRRPDGHAALALLPFEKFFIEAACNDQKSPEEYEELHANLREFDEKMRVDARTDWQQEVLQNLPAGLFEQLVSRRSESGHRDDRQRQKSSGYCCAKFFLRPESIREVTSRIWRS